MPKNRMILRHITYYPVLKNKITLLTICCIVSLSLKAQQQFSGIILNKTTHQQIESASIYCPANKKHSISNNSGEFLISLPERDSTLLIVRHLSYHTLKVWINNNSPQKTISLVPKVINIKDVNVNAGKLKFKVHDLNKVTLNAKEIHILPAQLGEVDVLKVLEIQPGVFRTSEINAALNIRGGSGGHNSFVIDQQCIFNPNHLLGFISTFNADLIQEVSMQKNDFHPSLSGSLSSYIQIKNRIGDLQQNKGKVGIGLLSSRIMIEGPIKKGSSSFIIGARRSYFDIFAKAYNKKYEDKEDFSHLPEYNFNDIQLKLHSKFTPKLYGEINCFTSGDKLLLINKKDQSIRTDWNNNFISANIKYYHNPHFKINTNTGISNYSFNLNSYSKLFASSEIYRINYSLNAEYKRNSNILLTGGIIFKHTFYKYKNTKQENYAVLNRYRDKQFTNYYGIYFNSLFRFSKLLTLNTGLRINKFISDKTFNNISPRVSLSYKQKDSYINLAYSRTYQFSHLINSLGMNLPNDLWYPSKQSFPAERADQISLGFTRPITTSIHTGATAYYKKMVNLMDFRYGASILFNPLLNELVFGNGHSKGIEAEAYYKNQKLNIGINYTLADTWQKFTEINNGKAFNPPYDVTHNLNISGIYNISENIDFSLSWCYASPQAFSFPNSIMIIQSAYTDIANPQLTPIYDKRYNIRMPSTHRLDISLRYTKNHKKGRSILNFSIYNLYNRANPYFVYFEESNIKNENNTTKILPKQKALIPFLPSINYTYEFN